MNQAPLPQPTDYPGYPTYPGRPVETEREGLSFEDVVQAVRRRWWVIVLAGVAFAAAAWAVTRSDPPRYTASALVQKAIQRSPLEGMNATMSGSAQSLVASQVEVIRTRAVLGPVVDSLGLRLQLDESLARQRLLPEVEVRPGAAPGSFRLKPSSQGSQIALEDAESGQVLDTAPPGGTLRSGGLRLVLADSITLDEPVEMHVSLPEVAVERLRGRLGVEQVPLTPLIRLSYTDPDPELAAKVVGAVARAYQEHAAFVAREEAKRRKEFLAEQIASVSDSLQAAQMLQLGFQERSGTLAPEMEGAALIQSLMQTEAEARKLRYQSSVLTTLRQSLETEAEADEAVRRAMALGSEIVPGAAPLYNRMQELRTERSRLTSSRYGYTSEGASVEVIDSLIAETKDEMREMSIQAQRVVGVQLEEAERRLQEVNQEIRSLPSRSSGFLRLKQQAEAIQASYDLLAEKYFEAQIDEAVEGGDVEIVDPPVVPVRPDPSHQTRTIALALLVGMMLGTAGSVVAQYMDRSIKTGDQAAEEAGAPLLAAIPRFRGSNPGDGRRPLVAPAERSAPGEAFRSLVTMLRFSRENRPRLFSVSSAVPGEGKSLISANLAIMISGGKPTILVDADFPRPVQHLTFQAPRTPGLSDYLVEEASIEAVIRKDEGTGIDYITAGTPVPHSADLLSGDRFRQLLRELAERYDTVVVDTPPVLVMADATAVATGVDGVILVVRTERTDRLALRRSAEQIRQVGGSVLGVVLNDVTATGGYGGYSYGAYNPGAYAHYVGNGSDGAPEQSPSDRLKKLLRR